jgi:hypothetical protein
MKKTLALLAVAALLLSTTGCGCCRGLFGKGSRAVASPLYSQCVPSCSAGPSCGSDCGCESGTPVTYGFDGSEPMYAPANMSSSGTFGQ